jgi:hypothetical protein
MQKVNTYQRGVFINAPFDKRYRPIFDVVVYCIIDCGFIARCALEVDDGSQVRLDKIYKIVEECRLAVHDLSRTQLDPKSRLPRFNMPFELGLFLGAKRFGARRQKQKNCIILDTERFRFQQFISDIAGQDPKPHNNDPTKAIKVVRDWLFQHAPKNGKIPSAKIIATRFAQFQREMPSLCKAKHWDRNALTFKEKVDLMFAWIKATPL